MSLRLQIVALFTAVLAATLLVASTLGLRIAQRSIEGEIRDRTLALASATARQLARNPSDDESVTTELATIAGGSQNTIQTDSSFSTIGGGSSNTNGGRFATVPGGGGNSSSWGLALIGSTPPWPP